MKTSDIVIIGAGITGAATAWWLTEAGVSVTLIDQYGPAAMASGWTLAGVRQSGRHPAELPFAKAAVAMWEDLDETLGAQTGYRQNGNLRLARTQEEVSIIRALVDDQSLAGLDLSFLSDRQEILEIAPALSEHILAASFCSTDGHADPTASVNALIKAAERNGARFQPGLKVVGLETKGGRFIGARTEDGLIEADVCLIATGITVNDLLSPLGLNIPLRLPIVTVVQTIPLPPTLLPVLGVANADLAGRQEVNGSLRVTSGARDMSAELRTLDGNPHVAPPARAIKETIEKVSNVLPVLNEAPIQRVWGGLLDLTPDGLPVLDQAPDIQGLFVAAGFSGHGFGIGPAVGKTLSERLTGVETAIPINAFGFQRFEEGMASQPLTLHG